MLALAAFGWLACNKIDEPAAVPAQAPALKQQPAASPPAAPAPAPEPQPPAAAAEPELKPGDLKPGWSRLDMKDTLPVCAFSSTDERVKAPYIEEAKKQTLAEDDKVTFGVFGPWCLNSQCDDLPLLECWVDRESEDTLVLHTHFFAFHRDGATCSKDCLKLDASCDTPNLPRGKYYVRHGDKTFQMQIPSVLKKPCDLFK